MAYPITRSLDKLAGSSSEMVLVIVFGLISGLLVGVLSGLLGIGGGIILVPILLYFFGMRSAEAAGTSLAVVIPTAIAGIAAHLPRGNISWRLVILLSAGSAVGAIVGARLGAVLPEAATRRVFAVLLVLVAVRVFFDTGDDSGAPSKVDIAHKKTSVRQNSD